MRPKLDHSTLALRPSSLLSLFIMLGCALSIPAQAAKHISVKELREVHLPDVTLESVTAMDADAQKDIHVGCVRVMGVIGGTIRFELLLPDEWNGRMTMGGGGGFVGSVQNGARDSVNHGYATVGTDTGHEWQPGYSAQWAYNNLEAQLNFGYLAVHRTAQVAEALVRDYYGAAPTYRYFLGCSRGGGQAMMEAQRYPQDFDGIVAGAPAFDWTGLAALSVTIAKTLYPDPAHLNTNVLEKVVLQKLRDAILEQCDAQDGLKDGVVQDPPSAGFDLSKMELTEQQRAAIAAIYAGARAGQQQLYPGYSPGAECDPDQWIAWITGPAPQLLAQSKVPDLMFAFGTQIWKFLVFNNPDWNYATYDLSNFTNDTRLAASFLNATDTDLAGLKARKGKLILWHGWADPALPAQATVNYYRQVEAHDPESHAYCRLFMVPGCLHCGGGPGASEVDWLSVIAEWVERGKAPDRIVASKREQGKVVKTRPLFCYPGYAVYQGSGDPTQAENFRQKTD